MSTARLTILAALLVAACSSSNHKPAFFPIGNQNVETGSTLEFDIKAVDDDGDALTFSIQDKPADAVFQDLGNNTASFSWSPIASDAGEQGTGKEWPVTFMVSDGVSSDSETIIITVTLGGAGTGAPVFLTPADHTLDLTRKDRIKFNIEVRDPDSASVTLSAVDKIPGSEFQTSSGSKLAAFEWTPTTDQVLQRPVWSFRVEANDATNPSVFQDITILIKGRTPEESKRCEGTSPQVTHDALADQRGAEDYPVTVTASDDESAIAGVSLYWKIDSGEEAGDFQKGSMSLVAGDSWQGTIPNPGLEGDATATVTYYVCALDDDDAAGSDCDKRTCIPEDDRFAFTAYAPGNNQCADDAFEANDTATEATLIEFDQNGECYYGMRKICPANEDWFELTVPAAYQLGVLLGHTEANGRLEMDLIDQDGSTLLLSGTLEDGLISLFPEAQPHEQQVFLRVRGTGAMVENSYDLYAVAERYEQCAPDSLEPNDGPDNAKQVVVDHVYTGLTSCGEPDWYQMELNQGDSLEVLLTFSHTAGDLDLAVFDPAVVHMQNLSVEQAMGYSTTETDDEYVQINIPADNTYYIVMAPYQGARGSYEMLVGVTPFAGCTDDDEEPNDTPQEAGGVWPTLYPGLVLCPDNDDWYYMWAEAGEVLVVDLTFTHADGDLDVIVHDPGVVDGNPVEHEIDGGVSTDDNEHVEITVEDAGNHYILVTGYQGASNDYDMEISTR